MSCKGNCKEDILREPDEVPQERSFNEIDQNEEEPASFRNSIMNKDPDTEFKKVMNSHLPVNSEKKKLAFSGMLGITQQEINKLFITPMIITDLDDFTETFFNKAPSVLDKKDEIKKGKENIRNLETPKRISSSMLDFEDSNYLASPREFATPNIANNFKQNCDQDRSPLENLNDPPFMTVSAKYRNASPRMPEGVKKNNDKVMKEAEKENFSEKVNMNLALSKELIGENKENVSPIKQEIVEFPQEIPEAIFEEKFILKVGEISAESTYDVKPRKALIMEIPETNINIVNDIPPYKLKITIIPTEWPVERRIEKEVEEICDVQSNNNNNNESQRDLSTSFHSRDVSENNGSILSKGSKGSSKSKRRCRRTTKKKPKSKKRRIKKAPDDSSSKMSNGSKKKSNATSPPSLEGSKLSGSKHNNNDGNSAMGSIVPNSKKDETNTIIGEGKNQKITGAELSEIKKNPEQDSIQKKPEIPWSGQEVLPECDPYAAVWITSKMSDIRIWAHGYKGIYENIRRMVRKFVNSEICENFMNLLVIINTVTLAMDRYNQPKRESDIMEKLNYVFTSVFTVELVLKMFGLGLVKYLSNSLNYLDFMVVIFSWIEIIFLGGNGAFSAFRTFRVFRLLRTVRVLRVARLLRGIQSMMTLLEVIANTIGSFGYIGLMLLIIMLIYALFGMTLFAGRWNYPDGLPRPNFDSFNNAFISVFQLLTVENWPSLLYSGMRNQFQPLVALYYISFIMIGNYILLNMFLAIMLDSFVEVSALQEDEEEDVY